MRFWKKITDSNFFIRLRSWEYWPFGIIQLPAIIYWLWLSIRSRSLVFFSASNPGIPTGGMFGESKYDILEKIRQPFKPRTILVQPPFSAKEVKSLIIRAGLSFPLVFKPDIGERGFMVRKIRDEQEVEGYLQGIKADFLIQELIRLPLEFGIFFMKLPGEGKGKVISVVAKEMLSVTGNGRATLQELIFRNPRAKLQWRRLKHLYQERLTSIIPENEKLELVSIGNHALGTRFINANHLINQRLSDTFDSISSHIPEFYFGRFDLRCASLEDLYMGNVKIMELNGCGAEPAHIYDQDFSIWRAMAVLVVHWHRIFKISRANKKRGISYISHRDALAFYRKFKSAVQ
jgi:hypothetical protein